MMQIQFQANVENNSPIVEGVNTTFTQDVEVGQAFAVVGDNVTYTIASVDNNTQITLSAPYQGSTESGVLALVVTDYTNNYSLPEIARGDLESGAIYTRAVRQIDDVLGGLGDSEHISYVPSGLLESENVRDALDELGVKRVIPLSDITSLTSLNTASLVDGQQFSVRDEDKIRYFAWNEGDGNFDELPVVTSASNVEGAGTAITKDTGAEMDQIPLNANIVYPLPDISSLLELDTGTLTDKQQFSRKEFWPGTGVGGVDLYWDASRPTSEHNGGTIIDPAKISELDTVNKTFGAYFEADTVSGDTGCFVVGDALQVDLSAFGGLPGEDVTKPLTAALAAMSEQGGGSVTADSGEYFFSRIVMPGNAALVGQGEDSTKFTIIPSTDSVNPAWKFDQDTKNHLLSRLTIDFNRENYDGEMPHAIGGDTDTENVILRDVVLTGAKNRTFSAHTRGSLTDGERCRNYYLENVKILDSGDKCLQARKVVGFQALNCYSEANVTDASNDSSTLFEASTSFDVIFTGCSGRQVGLPGMGAGFRCVNGSADVQFIGGTVEDTRQGLFATNAKNVTFSGQTVIRAGAGGGASGILIQSNNSPDWGDTENITVENALIIDPIGTGCTVNIPDSTGSAVRNVRVNNSIFLSSDGSMVHAISNGGDTTGSGKTCEVYQSNTVSRGQASRILNGDVLATQTNESGSVRIEDDDFATIDLSNAESGIVEYCVDRAPRFSGICSYRAVGNGNIFFVGTADDSRNDIALGALTGTTGTDGNVTVSVADRKLYIENRSGEGRRFRYMFRVGI